MQHFTQRLALGLVTAAFFALPVAVHAQSATGDQPVQFDDSNSQSNNSQCEMPSNQCDERNASINGQSGDGQGAQTATGDD